MIIIPSLRSFSKMAWVGTERFYAKDSPWIWKQWKILSTNSCLFYINMKAGRCHCFWLDIHSGIERNLLLFFHHDAKSVMMLWATSTLFLKRICFQKTTEDCFTLMVGFYVFHGWFFKKIVSAFWLWVFNIWKKKNKFYINEKNLLISTIIIIFQLNENL